MVVCRLGEKQSPKVDAHYPIAVHLSPSLPLLFFRFIFLLVNDASRRRKDFNIVTQSSHFNPTQTTVLSVSTIMNSRKQEKKVY